MPIDTRIPLSVFANAPDYGQILAQSQALKDQRQRRQMNQLALQQEQMQVDAMKRKQAEQLGVQEAFANAKTPDSLQSLTLPVRMSAGYDTNAAPSTYTEQGGDFSRPAALSNLAQNPNTAHLVPQYQQQWQIEDAKLQEALMAIKEKRVSIDKTTLDNTTKQMDLIGRLASPLAEAEKAGAAPEVLNAEFNKAVAQANQLGLDTSSMGTQYIPGIGQRTLGHAIAVKDALDNARADAALGETKRHNAVAEQNQKATQELTKRGQDITKRGQDMVDARSREQNDIKRNEKMEMNKAADQNQLNEFNSDMDNLALAANELLNDKGLAGITGMRGLVPNVPGTPAARAAAKLQTLKTKVAFGTLQRMRNASKTGGALGQVSDTEQKMLQNSLAPLDTAQSEEDFKKALAGIVQNALDAKDRAATAIQNKYSGAPAAKPKADPLGIF